MANNKISEEIAEEVTEEIYGRIMMITPSSAVVQEIISLLEVKGLVAAVPSVEDKLQQLISNIDAALAA